MNYSLTRLNKLSGVRHEVTKVDISIELSEDGDSEEDDSWDTLANVMAIEMASKITKSVLTKIAEGENKGHKYGKIERVNSNQSDKGKIKTTALINSQRNVKC